MTAYAIAQLRIHDPARFGKYVAGFMPVLTKYGGRLLATDGQPEVMEGEWTGDRFVIYASAVTPVRAGSPRWRRAPSGAA